MACKGEHAMWECPDCARYRQDQAFLNQVQSLMGTAKMAREEAEQYAEDIRDPELRKQAMHALEDE